MPSSVVAAYSYDASTKVLTITYVSGMVYQYIDVPEHIYDEMKRSKSKGIYLNKQIKGKYSFRKMD